MPRSKKNRYITLVYISMGVSLASMTVLFFVFLYSFQQMRIKENPNYKLPQPLAILALVSSLILFLSLALLLVFSMLYFSKAKSQRERIEKENREALERMKDEIKRLGIVPPKERRFVLKQNVSEAGIRKTIRYVYEPFFLSALVCTLLVFIVVFSISFLLENPMLLIVFGCYFIIPLFGYLMFQYVLPKKEAEKAEKTREIYFYDDKIQVLQKNQVTAFSYQDVLKFKEIKDGFLLVYQIEDKKKNGLFISIDKKENVRLYEFLSMKLRSRGDILDGKAVL